MKTKILVATLLAGLTSYSFAASNVTLYGQIDLGVVASKAKHKAATFEEKSGFVGMSRWGIKGSEDLQMSIGGKLGEVVFQNTVCISR